MARNRAPRVIAVEGVIGVGKTTLARALAAHAGATFLSEDDCPNPFLTDFYHQRQRWALACQLAFLEGRVAQFTAHPRPVGPVVTDHTLDKELLFAGVLLDQRELELYRRLYTRLVVGDILRPDVVVYLTAEVDQVMDRIRNRGRAYEDHIDRAYLSELLAAYQAWFTGPGNDHQKVVVVDGDGAFIAEDPAAVARLADACTAAPKGLSYCNPVVA